MLVCCCVAFEPTRADLFKSRLNERRQSVNNPSRLLPDMHLGGARFSRGLRVLHKQAILVIVCGRAYLQRQQERQTLVRRHFSDVNEVI